MIEVVFSDSTKGSMRVAKNYDRENMIGGAIGYIGTPPSKDELEKNLDGKALGGTSDEVVGISLYLDIGDIKSGAISNVRKELIFKMFRHPYKKNEGDITWKHDYWEVNLSDIKKLLDCAKEDQHIRIWYSDAPYSICGFYYVISQLKEYMGKVTVVKLPKTKVKEENTIISYTSWAEVEPGRFFDFLPLEKEITLTEKRFIASRWHELQMENAPLRAVVNGKLVSIPEDFYDYFIRQSLLDGEFTVARLIGTVLGNHQLGIGDWWVAQRIDFMIANGELEVVSDKEFGYSRMLKRSNNK